MTTIPTLSAIRSLALDAFEAVFFSIWPDLAPENQLDEVARELAKLTALATSNHNMLRQLTSAVPVTPAPGTAEIGPTPGPNGVDRPGVGLPEKLVCASARKDEIYGYDMCVKHVGHKGMHGNGLNYWDDSK